MPKISLVVCLHKERDLLERLLQHASGCYDDLVVVHDGPESAELGKWKLESGTDDMLYEVGWESPEDLSLREPDAPPIKLARDFADLPPDGPMPTGYRLVQGVPATGSTHELVCKYGGRFFEGPRCFQQEPHWPFGWWAAKHDWILRLDADEFPSPKMKDWLIDFKGSGQSPLGVSGYNCIWPLWNGKVEKWTQRAPSRLFLFSKSLNESFGMAETQPMPFCCAPLPIPLLLHHQPRRKSYGISNLLYRNQAYSWRRVIALSLLKSPLQLPRWKYTKTLWPDHWENLKKQNLREAAYSSVRVGVGQMVYEVRHGSEILISAFLGTTLNQFLMAWTFKRVLKESSVKFSSRML